MIYEEIKCRTASSLGGGFSGAPEEVWSVTPYNEVTDKEKSCVFFGLYGLPDFYTLWRHKGKKWILWCGSDIRHFVNGYWLDDKGEIRINPRPLAEWIIRNCESYVENKAEYDALKKLGIESKIIPSFLGDVSQYEVSYQPSNKPKIYASVSSNDFVLYGWYEIEQIYAPKYPDIEFHLFGNTIPFPTENKNVIIHGRVSQEQMNEEIKNMQGALRLLSFDGASEVLIKSILWGQWPVSFIKYPHMLSIDELDKLKDKKEPNIEGREYYRKIINSYPWNTR